MDYPYMSYGDRRTVRDIDGTPIKQYKFASIGASSKFVLDIAEDYPTWKKYLPFNSVTFKNNSGVDIDIYINQDQNKIINVPSGTIITYGGEVGIWSLTAVNLNVTTASTADKLVAEFERTGMDTNKFTKDFSKTFLGRLITGNIYG
jgi:hypothetical protein